MADRPNEERASGRETKKRRLGRGLGSLLGTPVSMNTESADESVSRPAVAGAAAEGATTASDNKAKQPPDSRTTPSSGSADHSRAVAAAAPTGGLVQVAVDAIRPNHAQPRQDFDPSAIAALASSLRQDGLLQPIIVRRGSDGGFELVAGERRWRAAQALEWDTIPAFVRDDVDERGAAELALIENIQREDLNPIERAEALGALRERFELTHTEIAERVGIDRSSVTNLLRLNDLDAFSSGLVRSGALSLGHAKALLGLPSAADRRRLAAAAANGGWSVRMLEERAKATRTERDDAAGRGGTAPSVDDARRAHVEDLERRLGEVLGTKTRIRLGRKRGTGRIEIDFFSLEQFDEFTSRLGLETDDPT